MTDLRQAAQALLNRWDSPLWKNGSTADAIADLRAALEQQAEPVAWIVDGGKKNGELLHTHEYALELVAPKIMCKPLYTAPPQRKPLTDEQVHAIWDHKYRGWFSRSQIEDITRAIEAAHGIKGGT